MTQEEIWFNDLWPRLNTMQDLADYLNTKNEYPDLVWRLLDARGWERPANNPETIAVHALRNECVNVGQDGGYFVGEWLPKIHCLDKERNWYCLESGEMSEEDCQTLTRFWEYEFGECYYATYSGCGKIGRWYADRPSEIYRLVLSERWREVTNKMYVTECHGMITGRTIEGIFRD